VPEWEDGRCEKDGITYTVDDLSQEVGVTSNEMKTALKLFEKNDMVHWDGDCLVITNHYHYQVNPSTSRQRRSRDKKSNVTNSVTSSVTSNVTKDGEAEAEAEDKKKEVKYYPFQDYLLKDSTIYRLPWEKFQEWEVAYPEIVHKELKKAGQWCRDNPDKRKTRRGMTRFLGAWLMRAQEKMDQGRPPKQKVGSDDEFCPDCDNNPCMCRKEKPDVPF
jgi:hypothetical protein